MPSSTAEQLVNTFDQLTLPEQLWLIVQFIQHIRERMVTGTPIKESDLRAMAEDPEIRRELQEIDVAFLSTEADGLE